jgi:PiT family inorganic phosphate transporter
MSDLFSFILANGNIFIIIAAIFAFFMAWGIGANDVANAMGTSVGTKTITIKQAIIIAMIFEFCGAYFAGGEVVSTIQDRIISKDFPIPPADLIIGMISSLLAAGVWLIVASYFSWPVSTTHTIIGAIVGFGAVTCGMEAINWGMFSGIVGSWVITPVIAGIMAFLLFMHIQRYIFCRFHPLRHAKKNCSILCFLNNLSNNCCYITKRLKACKHHFNN